MMPLCGLVLHLAGVLALEPVEVPPLLPPSADAPDPELALEEPKVLPPLGDAMRRAYGAAGLAAILGLPLFPTAALGVASAVPLAMLGAMFLGLFVGPFAGPPRPVCWWVVWWGRFLWSPPGQRPWRRGRESRGRHA